MFLWKMKGVKGLLCCLFGIHHSAFRSRLLCVLSIKFKQCVWSTSIRNKTRSTENRRADKPKSHFSVLEVGQWVPLKWKFTSGAIDLSQEYQNNLKLIDTVTAIICCAISALIGFSLVFVNPHFRDALTCEFRWELFVPFPRFSKSRKEPHTQARVALRISRARFLWLWKLLRYFSCFGA